jgi:hypothetical protein
MGIEPRGGTGAGDPVEPPGGPHEGDPTVELDLPVTEQRTRAFEQLRPQERPTTEQPLAAEPPVDRTRQTDQFALPVDAPGTAQAPGWTGGPPAAGGPRRRRPGIGVLVGVGAVIVALVAVAALALPSLTGDNQA